MPETRPRLVGRRWCHHSMSSQVSAPAAAAVCVVANARPAMWPATGCSAATALPALKPNQPNHSSPAPSSVSVRLWGRIADRPGR